MQMIGKLDQENKTLKYELLKQTRLENIEKITMCYSVRRRNGPTN